MTNRIKVFPVGTTKRIFNIAATNNIRTKKKEPHIVREILNDYCLNSSLHGIHYLGAKDKRPAEKIWWMIMFILSLTACAFLISRTWTRWKDSPVLISFEKEQIPIWHIPFPAITVCSLNKIMATENCMSHVIWRNAKLYLPECFTEQLTEDGLCFSFNTLSQNDMFTDQINKNTNYIDHNFTNDGWNVEDGYLPELNINAYPRRTDKDGRISGLSFNLDTFQNEIDHVCGLPISGYKVTLHNPTEIPKVADQYFLIPFNKQVTIIVRPELTKTDPNLMSLPPETRKCYFSNEKSLRFLKIYTQHNCRVECDANITQDYCGCVPFYMPRDVETNICGYGKAYCVQEVQSALLDFEVQEEIRELKLKNKEKLEKTRDIFKNCHCLPSCSSLQYTAESSLTELHVIQADLESRDFDNNSDLNFIEDLRAGKLYVSQVDIYFKESQFLALQRSELYGQTDFLANCGGLLGLFMGFSLLSILEIIYFLTIRLWFKYRMRQKH